MNAQEIKTETDKAREDAAWVASLNTDSLCSLVDDGIYCVEVDANKSIDRGNPYLDFEWEFAPGVKKKGVIAEYCYDDPGHKEIWLNVIDTRTRRVRKHDTVVRVYCIPSIVPFEVSTNPTLKNFLKLSVPKEIAKNCPYNFIWKFGDDGPIKRGISVGQPFSKQGIYKVMLLQVDESGEEPVVISAYCQEIIFRGTGTTGPTIIPKDRSN